MDPTVAWLGVLLPFHAINSPALALAYLSLSACLASFVALPRGDTGKRSVLSEVEGRPARRNIALRLTSQTHGNACLMARLNPTLQVSQSRDHVGVLGSQPLQVITEFFASSPAATGSQAATLRKPRVQLLDLISGRVPRF